MLLLFGTKEKKIKKLEEKKRQTITMIAYYEQEINKFDSESGRKSFPKEDDYKRYLENLKSNLLKTHNKLIEICKMQKEVESE